MIVGYVFDHALGLLLAGVLLAAASDGQQRRISKRCMESFRDCTTFFAFSIEIASIVVLVFADWGISTSGMGDDTIRITHAVSMLVLLALLYPMIALGDGQSEELAIREGELVDAKREAEASKSSDAFWFLVLCWLLAIYPFFSKMSAAFGRSDICDRPDCAISQEQFNIIRGICLRKTDTITTIEGRLMTAFVMLTYIPLSLFVIGRIVWYGLRTNAVEIPIGKGVASRAMKALQSQKRRVPKVALIMVGLNACGLLWSIFRPKGSQQELDVVISGVSADNTWTFGQIVAVTVFAPVVWECVRSLKTERKVSKAG